MKENSIPLILLLNFFTVKQLALIPKLYVLNL